jgi:excisionase family DNA binding protein
LWGEPAAALERMLPLRVYMVDKDDERGPVHSLLIEQAAQVMGVSRRTVYYRIREGRLETIRTRCGSRRIVFRTLESLIREGARKNPFKDRSAGA